MNSLPVFDTRYDFKDVVRFNDQKKMFAIYTKNKFFKEEIMYNYEAVDGCVPFTESSLIEMDRIEGFSELGVRVNLYDCQVNCDNIYIYKGEYIDKDSYLFQHYMNDLKRIVDKLNAIADRNREFRRQFPDQEPVSDKGKAIALTLDLFTGVVGGHHFYLGNTKKGLLYLFTGGLFGIGPVVDAVKIIANNMKDKDGFFLTEWDENK